MEHTYNIIMYLLAAIIIVALLLKSISIIVKIITILIFAAAAYFLYGIYPKEVIITGIIFLGSMILWTVIKRVWKNRKKK